MSKRTKVMYRVRKARARLTDDIPNEVKGEIIKVTYWAARGDYSPHLIDRLNAVAQTKRLRQ